MRVGVDREKSRIIVKSTPRLGMEPGMDRHLEGKSERGGRTRKKERDIYL